MFRVGVRGDQQLAQLARDLKRAGGTHRQRVAGELRKPTKATYQAIERRILHGSMRGYPVRRATERVPPGLGAGNHVRRPVLSGLSWKVSTSAGDPKAEVTWNPLKITARVRPLFKYLVRQAREKYVRHPIFGKTRDGRWRGGANQDMPDAWAPARKLPDEVQKAVAKVCDDTAAMIAGRKR